MSPPMLHLRFEVESTSAPHTLPTTTRHATKTSTTQSHRPSSIGSAHSSTRHGHSSSNSHRTSRRASSTSHSASHSASRSPFMSSMVISAPSTSSNSMSMPSASASSAPPPTPPAPMTTNAPGSTTTDLPSHKKPTLAIAISTVIGSIVLIFLLVLVIYFLRRKRRHIQMRSGDVGEAPKPSPNVNIPLLRRSPSGLVMPASPLSPSPMSPVPVSPFADSMNFPSIVNATAEVGLAPSFLGMHIPDSAWSSRRAPRTSDASKRTSSSTIAFAPPSPRAVQAALALTPTR